MANTTTKGLGFKLIEDVQEEDYIVMAKLWQDSFLTDAHTNLKVYQASQGPLDDSPIRAWAASDNCHLLKAISTSTNEIMGWVCWGHRGYTARKPQPESTSEGVWTSGPAEKERTPIQNLTRLTGDHFKEFMTDIMPEGVKCWYICTLVVAPQYQGMGLGRRMIEWGTSRAEKDGVFAWVHSSNQGWQAYQACGFETVRMLTLNLDEYAAGGALGKGPEPGGKWGDYTFRYMVYKPERAVAIKGKSLLD